MGETELLELGKLLLKEKRVIADRMIALQWEAHPEFSTIFGESGKEKCHEDSLHHITYLSDACVNNSLTLFNEYTSWLFVLMESLNIPLDSVKENYRFLREAVAEIDPRRGGKTIVPILEDALSYALTQPKEPDSFISSESFLGREAEECLHLLLSGQRREASRRVLELSRGGTHPKDIYLNIFQPVQLEVGRLWQLNKITVAQEHYTTASVNMMISQLYPLIFSAKRRGKSFIGASIGNELHEIGIRMVTDFLEMEGWDTYFFGSNTPADTILGEVRTRKPDVVGFSTTIARHLGDVRALIRTMRETKELSSIPIMVGGYPFNLDNTLWKKLEADGWARNAEEAVSVAEELLRE